MKYVLMIFVLLVVAAVLAVKKLGLLDAKEENTLPFKKKDYFLSKAEISFFHVLGSILDEQWLIFTKIRLIDLVSIPRGTENYQSHRNRVQAKHVDFVLCDRKSVTPVLVIELDDSSHNKPNVQKRDQFVNAVMKAAGLPILRIPVQKGYDTRKLQQMLQAALSSKRSATPTPAA